MFKKQKKNILFSLRYVLLGKNGPGKRKHSTPFFSFYFNMSFLSKRKTFFYLGNLEK